ncbi:uncharacterized protein N7487_008616 [Penicillium crustosum]|uniref:uncharacterized protein n=1 Tax=Penicillium crustosum TaxID=36656 RepID=UPI0023856875|nr:uncharacterized protein N7487_008616 [Penicillium crustosum]KAJ5402720.1 hypothetical protein N7487_008616 [Penicillium crustosum]
MSDPTNPHIKERTTPQWGLYQRENFWKQNEGTTPLFNTDPRKMEERAKEKLSEGGWYYASSNAGMSNTHLANRQAFYRHRLIPNQLIDTNNRSTTTTIFDHKVSAPIGFAPIGINKIYHPTGEAAVSKVANELNLPYCLSTAGSTSIEKVAAANGPSGTRFFQLYMPHDDELTVSLLTRAWENGFDALILTTDTWQLGWRHDDVASSNYAFYRGFGADLGLTDPVFRKRCVADGIDPDVDIVAASTKWIDSVWHGRAWSWEKIPWLMETWRGISGGRPFVIKGIQSVGDVRRCVGLGVEGIVGASDIVKALALGARFVFIGRLWIWGLSIQGEDGVRHVMKSLLADLDILMGVAGFNGVEDFNRDILESDPKNYTLIPQKTL